MSDPAYYDKLNIPAVNKIKSINEKIYKGVSKTLGIPVDEVISYYDDQLERKNIERMEEFELSRKYIDNIDRYNTKGNLRKADFPSDALAYIANKSDIKDAIPLYINAISRALKPKIERVVKKSRQTAIELSKSAREIEDEKEIMKLNIKYDNLTEKIKELEDENYNLAGSETFEDRRVVEINEKKIEKLLLQSKNILKKIAIIDKELADEIHKREKDRQVKQQAEEREQNKILLEKRKKYKKMALDSNKLAEEVRKTIIRDNAAGYEYSGRGRKVKKSKKVAMGGMYHESTADEVAYILEKISKMLKKGDIQHIELVAKKLRKAKKIGKGKYYLFEDEYVGDGYPTGGERKKEKKEKKPLSEKQKEWMALVDMVQAKYPKLSRKEAMIKASEKRRKSKSK